MRAFINDIGWWFESVRIDVRHGWRSLSRLFKLSLLGFALAAVCYGAYVPLVHTYGVTIHPLHARPTLDPIGTWAHEYAQAPLQTVISLALAALIAGVALLYVAACTQSIARSLAALGRRQRARRRTPTDRRPPDTTARPNAGVGARDDAVWDEVVATAREAGSEAL